VAARLGAFAKFGAHWQLFEWPPPQFQVGRKYLLYTAAKYFIIIHTPLNKAIVRGVSTKNFLVPLSRANVYCGQLARRQSLVFAKRAVFWDLVESAFFSFGTAIINLVLCGRLGKVLFCWRGIFNLHKIREAPKNVSSL